jgi:hypothetical protein
MTDSPSPVLQLRIQSVGSNVNLWGGYINTDLAMLEQAAKGYQTLAVTGDAAVSWTNYATGNTGAAARLKLTGSPGAPCTLTLPAYHNFISVENATTVAVTIKCSGGTGVSIAAGAKVLIYCDGVDYYNAAPTKFPTADVTFAGKLKGVTAGTDGTDAVNLTQMQAAIAVLATAQNGLVFNSATATAAQYLEDALAVTSGGGLSKTKTNGGTASEASSLALELSGMTALTAPADADVVPVYDASAAAHRKMTLANLLVAGWSSLTDVRDLDNILLYDASAALIKKALLADVVRRQNASSYFFATA